MIDLNDATTVQPSIFSHSIDITSDYYNNSQYNNENNEGRLLELDEDESTEEERISIYFPNTSGISFQKFINSQADTCNNDIRNLLFLFGVYVLCNKCKENYCLSFQDLNHITAECRCKCISQCETNNFIDKYLSKEDLNFKCKSHNNEKIIKYCWDCKEDLCRECLKELSKHNNKSKKHTKHETHTIIDLNDVDEYMKKVKELLKNNKEIENKNELKKIIECLINYYKKCPTYGGYKTLKKLSKGFQFNEQKNNKLEPGEYLIINSIKELKAHIDTPEKIYKIKINGEKTGEEMENLSILKEKEFMNLKSLIMNNIKLKDISALNTCMFPKLRRLDFESNEIKNNCICTFKNLELPVIKFLSLFDNKIASPQIFDIVKKYRTLKTFFIGKNKFDKNKLKSVSIKKTQFELPEGLEELGITNNFSKNNLSFIFRHLSTLVNLKILYITGNGFTTLEGFENIHFTKLVEFWCRGDKSKGYLTNIREIEHLQGKETIEKIVLKENNINNIEELKNIIGKFPKLKELNLENNEIIESKIKRVLEEIKKIKGYENFKIKY